MTETIRTSIDSDHIATWTIDIPDRSMNVFTPEFFARLDVLITESARSTTLKGVIITSGKPVFLAGADIKMLDQMMRQMGQDVAAMYERCAGANRLLRRLETCGKPVVAALNGTAMGGGLETALACHYRVVADDPRIQLGLPEVKIGLLPGAGGTQRLPRLIGLQPALMLLVEGNGISPREALKLGLVNQVVPAEQLLSAAKAWLLTAGDPVAPWDKKGFKAPIQTGLLGASASQVLMGASAMVQQKTYYNYPAPKAILSCVYEGCQVPIDVGLRIESKYFTTLIRSPEARNMIRTLFINKGAADKLSRRPVDVPPSKVGKLGLLGAGMMGSGIAYVSAAAGIEVVLLDRDLPAAEKGKGYSRGLVEKAVSRGKMSAAEGEALLGRIRPTTDFADLAGVDLVIEAVFEDRVVKADATAKAEVVMPKGSIFASNTSTLPITGLAEASSRPKQFVGIHFFSPVDKMPLVEVIVGKKTGSEALARALDYVRQIRKTPIVVNDGRGFLLSRVCGAYINEGMSMLLEGVAPALIENAGRMAGMPVGPLALHDEVAIDLSYHIREQTKKDLGDKFKPASGDHVLDVMVELGRFGRKAKKGYYDYPENGKKHLWPGLVERFPVAKEQPSVEVLKKRLLYVHALETIRAMEDKVLTNAAEGDIGAIFGLGFAPYTGGPLSLVDTVGVAEFAAECKALGKKYGDRFAPPKLLRNMALRGEKFYP